MVFCSVFLVAATLPTHKDLIMECYGKKTIAMALNSHALYRYLNNPDAFEWSVEGMPTLCLKPTKAASHD